MININYSYRSRIVKGIEEIANEKVEILGQLWRELFEKSISMDHLGKLINHVDAFFTDIIVETENRKEAIMERIESKFLKSECSQHQIIKIKFRRSQRGKRKLKASAKRRC